MTTSTTVWTMSRSQLIVIVGPTGAGKTDRLDALRPRRPAGEDAEGGCGYAGDITVIYFQAGEKDYMQIEKGY